MPVLFSAKPLSLAPPANVSPRLQAFLASRKCRRHALTSFVVLPQNIRFETQRDQEPIILFLRRHPITNLPWIVVAILMLLAPVIVIPFVSSMDLIVQLFSISPGLPVVLIALWYLTALGYSLSNFLVWYFTVNIATNERVIDIDFFFLLYKEFSEALLSRIEDVTFIMGGFIQAFFDYGDVLIQTAAATERIDFDRIPKPRDVVQILSELIEDVEKP